jgi:hypothetical protein
MSEPDLIELLLDRDADLASRDDAALDLGGRTDSKVIEALAAIATDDQAPETLQETAGESLAECWLAAGQTPVSTYLRLTKTAKAEVDGLPGARWDSSTG